MQRARVTSRIESDPDHRGRRRLLAREGEIVTPEQARSRGIPEEALEPVGPDARVSTTEGRPVGPVPGDQDTRVSDDNAQNTGESPPAGDGDAGGDGDDFPLHRGGPNWQLSDGSTVRGSRADAERAEAALQTRDDEDGEGEDGS